VTEYGLPRELFSGRPRRVFDGEDFDAVAVVAEAVGVDA